MSYGSKLKPLSRSLFDKLFNCTKQKNLVKGQTVHAHILKTGLSSCLLISNTLIGFYSKCRLLPQAHLAFDDTHIKDVVSWNSLIHGYSQLGTLASSVTVIDLFKLMIRENTYPNSHTFTGIFAAVSVLEDPFVGKQAHSMAIKVADFLDVFVSSSLLNAYCKLGMLDEARKVFDEIPERNSVSWSTMISGYAFQRSALDALDVFRMMLRGREESLNEFIFTSVLSGLALPELVDNGKQIHCLATKTGHMSFTSVGNALVTMYAKCGSQGDALWTFKSLDDKNSITWSALVTGHAQSGDSEEALTLFSHMHFSGMEPSEFTFVGVLNACRDIGAASMGKQAHGLALKLGLETHMYVLTALVDIYAKSGCVHDAKRGFGHLPEPDIALWTSMIGGYVQNGENKSAISLYSQMRIADSVPNELTMASILKACSHLTALEQGKQIHAHTIKFGFSLEVPVGSALSTMYAKCGSLDDGNRVFWRMPTRDVVSWNSMISGLSQNGLGDEALELFEVMLLEGTNPDYVTFVNVLSACSHMGLVDKGMHYFRMMVDKFNMSPKVDHFACIVDMLGRAGKFEEAKELIESVSREYGLYLWHIILSACCNCGNFELGAYAGEKLLELGSQDSSVYVILSSIYSTLGQSADVERVRRMMSLRGVSKEQGCSWIELKSQVHVFAAGDELHPQIKEIRVELWKLSKLMKDESIAFFLVKQV